MRSLNYHNKIALKFLDDAIIAYTTRNQISHIISKPKNLVYQFYSDFLKSEDEVAPSLTTSSLVDSDYNKKISDPNQNYLKFNKHNRK